jgi:hypothetical protein
MTSDEEQQQLTTQCLPDRIGFLGAGQVPPPHPAAGESCCAIQAPLNACG